MSRRLGNPPPFAEGLRGVLNSFDLDSDLDPSEGIIRSMTPPYLPAGPAHDADPAHPIDFFSAFFAVAFSNAFFMKFASHLGPQNRQKSHPGPKKCVRKRRRMRFSSIFGAVAVRNRFRGRFWTKKQQKNDLFLHFFDGARFFPDLANLQNRCFS